MTAFPAESGSKDLQLSITNAASAAANSPVCNEDDTVVVGQCPVHERREDDKPKKAVAYKKESPVCARFP
jgi:hypothetical protein